MGVDARRLWVWPCVLALLFFPVPLLLFYAYPSSFWAATDYQTLGLADALNMAYRIADREMYFARGMVNHPGVPFYFMNWLALALAGFPLASADPGFFDRVIEHVEEFYGITAWLVALIGAAGVYVLARAARKLVPIGVVAIGLLIWLTSTPATLFTFTSPSIDSFAILINGLFFAVLVRIAHDRDLLTSGAVLAACVGAFAYLSKLSYLYVPLALVVTGMANLAFRKVDPAKRKRLTLISTGSFFLIVAGVGVLVIGWSAFRILINFHKSVFLGSGQYGTGSATVVSGHELWNAVAAIPADSAYALPIALITGSSLIVGGYFLGRKGPEHIPVALISIGTGVASLFSALFVMKHYGFHYTAGVSATLPASAAACYLLATSWGGRFWFRTAVAALCVIAVSWMAVRSSDALMLQLAARTDKSRLAQQDLQEINARLASSQQPIEFGYRSPFSWSGEGFVIYYGSVPRMTDAYVASRQRMFSSGTANLIHRKPGTYVIDKAYFPTADSIRTAPNIIPDGPAPVTWKDGDKIIELRTVFLLTPG
ncbi:MAG: hypothetical protein ABJA75_24905 [Bradyrhizobium sp.]